MAEEKRAEGVSNLERLRASVERLEQRAREIPPWMMGTIVFAERLRDPASRPAQATNPPKK